MSTVNSRKKAAALRYDLIRTKAAAASMKAGSPCRFVADVMLGRLAKWLRIAGFDVLYSNRYSDDELVDLSRRESRILLSRDTRLLVRRTVRQFIYLESENLQDQIRQILESIRVRRLPGILTRCLRCNAPLEEIDRDRVRGKVPPFVYQTQAVFKTCSDCEKIYWAGTHRQHVLDVLQGLIPTS